MRLKLRDKVFGMRVWKWYILVAAWMAPPIIHLIKGDLGRAFELSLYMLLGVMIGRLAWHINMYIKNRKCKKLIKGYYMGRSTHADGVVLYTRIPIVMPPRSFDFKVNSARNALEVTEVLLENLETMYRMEPHLALFLKSWKDDGEGFPPWASQEEIDHIKITRDEENHSYMENEASHV